MLNLLIKPLLGVAGDVVKGVVATKKAKAEQKVTEIKAKTDLLNKQIKGEIDYDLTALQQSGRMRHGLFYLFASSEVASFHRFNLMLKKDLLLYSKHHNGFSLLCTEQ